MKDKSRLYLQRAENELVASQILLAISEDEVLQKETFQLEKRLHVL